MTVSWLPVVTVDIAGSILTLIIALQCAITARGWTRQKSDDIFRHYIFLLTLAIAFFAISRSFGHLVKQVLLLSDLGQTWSRIAPFSGAVNSAVFVVIFAFGVYAQRFQTVHEEVERYRANLEALVEERTRELAAANRVLKKEIEAHRRAEHELKRSKVTLEGVLNNTNPLCITSTSHEVLLANKAYQERWPTPETTGGPVRCFESRPGSLCHTGNCPLELILAGAPVAVCEVGKEDPDGTRKSFIVTARPFRDEEGTLVGIVESFQDITHRKRAEDALAAEKERLSVTLRSIGDGVITADTEGRVVLLNKVAEHLTGWTQAEAVGQPLEEVFSIVAGKSGERRESPAQKILAAGGIVDLEEDTTLIAKDGRRRSIADSGAAIFDRESRIIGVVLVFRDVTEKLRTEEELLKIKKLESVGVLAGGIAHDFNNILVAILGNLNLASQLLDPEGTPFARLQAAEKAALQARGLTQQLLTFSRGGEPLRETASIAEVIRDSASFVLHGGNVACVYRIPADLWLAEIDTGQMSQVIQNLIVNAAHAMPGGGAIDIACENVPRERLRGLALAQGDYVKITIRDTGIGIPPKFIDKIFDPYFSTKKEGSGLGLAITHSIVSKHNGQISVESQPGEGTTFSIYLPANPEARPKERKAADEALAGQGRILVMDDEDFVRDTAEQMLSYLGYKVVLARDGAEAVELYRKQRGAGEPIDLAIMDLTIPGGMGGKEAARKILEIQADASIVVSSGYSNDPVMAHCQDHGFRAAILKPYRLSELGRVVREALQAPGC
ncbi:MAG: hybrid sensor histidine kinase/response regulator [Candidatus Geothermincolia bacterium]